VGSAWDHQDLIPADARDWTGTNDSFSAAAAVLRGAGLPIDAWTVLTHTSAQGTRHPELCVQNAFGEIYRHALCPSQPQVRTYAATLVAQVLQLGQPDGLILEAVGPLGFGHQNQHEKTEGAEYSPWVQALLSLCFCQACSSTYEARGMAPQEFQNRVRTAIVREVNPHSTPETAKGAEELWPLLDVRWDATAALLDACLSEVAGSGADPRISLHVSPDPWSTGPFVPVEALRRSRLWPVMGNVTAVAPCWGDAAAGAATVTALRKAAPKARVGSYVLVLPPKPSDAGSMAREWDTLYAAGSNELHLYHLGLASTARLNAAVEALGCLPAKALVSPESIP
jgi:hypothetical protein